MNAVEQTHPVNNDCTGIITGRCPECGKGLCACELAYGHDCEAE